MIVRVDRIRDNAKLPVRAHESDAGMDLFYAPITDSNCIIGPQGSDILSTGLRIEVPAGYMLEVKNKGGIAAKKSLLVGSCVVDRGYDGEVFVNLINVGYMPQTIHPGDKIAQGVFVKIETDIKLVESKQIYNEITSRGDGKLGSSGDR